VTHALYKIGFVRATVLIFSINLTSVWAGAFFVDNGHTEVVEGVAFELVPPYLFIKKAFRLRGQNLTPAQLRIIQEAMPEIAGMTHQILTRANNRQTEAQAQAQEQEQVKPRNIYQIQNIEGSTQLYIQTLKNWQVTETSIQFSSDYFYTPSRGHKVNFRDTYVFTRFHNAWQFSKHPRSAPDGVLKCTKTAEGWMRCD
jgi:hypothetical protein